MRGIRASATRRPSLAAAALLSLWAPVCAEEPIAPSRSTHNLFGMTGLIDTPTADFQPDGQVSLTTSYFGGNLRTTLGAQFLPGIEGAFRYSAIDDFRADASTLFDRSFDIKFQLIEESDTWPSIAFGLQDFLGTGIYSGEYIVATKGFEFGSYGDFRVTGGIGWGRFASGSGVPNPFCELVDRYCNRDADFGLGGSVNFGQFFRGRNVGFFGGVEWLTPVEGLSLKLEYNNDDYTLERRNGGYTPKIPVSAAASYRLSEGVEIGAYYMYGNEFGIRLSLSGNPFRPLVEADGEPAPLPVLTREVLPNGSRIAALGKVHRALDGGVTVSYADPRLAAITLHRRLGNVRWADAILNRRPRTCPEDLARAIDAEHGVVDLVTFKAPGGEVICTVALRPAGEHAIRITSRGAEDYPIDWYRDETYRAEIVKTLVAALGDDSIGLYGVEVDPRRVSLFIENRRYHAHARAIGRAARILTRTMPPSIEIFEITTVEASLPISTVVLTRSQLEEQVNRPGAATRAWVTADVREGTAIPWDTIETPGGIAYPRFSWSVVPATPVNLFDPDQPVRLDLSLVGTASIEVTPGLSVNTAVSKRIVGGLDDIGRVSDSQLPKVRSDVANYLREGDPALVRLSADYLSKFDHGLYGRLSAGLLEQMYGGVSAEVLWKPYDRSWGLGLELNWVKQRDFETLLSFRDYDVVTGHASVYWNTGYYGLFAQVDAGRYLAGDWGATFTLKRRFANGWEFGGFFTLTDVPFSEFGEGSFDKGLFLTIPLNWFAPFETRGSYSVALRPLTRDGGQRLFVSNRLWSIAEGADRPHLRAGWEAFWE